jgi:transcription initiation factor IIF auxiliary subunit
MKTLKIEQSQKYKGDGWWSWSVWVAGSASQLDGIAKVEYTLHPTFAKPVRAVSTRRNQFKLSSEGWGGFRLYARVIRKDGTIVNIQHQLQLYYPDGK